MEIEERFAYEGGDHMRYRKLGTTGLKVSEIGLGCEGFAEDECRNTKRLLDAARECGVNYFDLYVSDPKVRASVGEALKGRRESFYVQFGVPIRENMRQAAEVFGK